MDNLMIDGPKVAIITGVTRHLLVTWSMLGIYPCATLPEYCAAKAAVHQWVRTVAPVLRTKRQHYDQLRHAEWHRDASYAWLQRGIPAGNMTVRLTLLTGDDLLLDDENDTETCKLIEAAHKELMPWGHPGHKSGGAFAKRSEKVYKPWFKMMYQETNELAGLLLRPPYRGLTVIAVTGATDSQGSGVVNVMKKVQGWRVRPFTGNPASDAATKLVEEGVELIQADIDNESSLKKAFEGKVVTPHMDYKANVDARIKSELPELAEIMTYLYFEYYLQNMAFFPLIKPFEYPRIKQYVQGLIANPNARLLLAGDMKVSPGIWLRQIIATGVKAYGNYVNVALEKLAFRQMIDV
ncbi:hscarg dehydrogenase [Stagonosporopsis vannaccii]|nr:hscarg dehydrogenase [Stagonosporopsis vannaccii]